MRRLSIQRYALAAALLAATAAVPDPSGAQTLYGGNGRGSTNPGALSTINQTTGAGTLIGGNAGQNGITGLAFGLDGTLWGTNISGPVFGPPGMPVPTSSLFRLNPATGNVLSTTGTVRLASGAPVFITDLAVQPGTGTLFGVGLGPNLTSFLYSINTTSAVATLIGDTGVPGQAIAFAPNGTLYYTSLLLNGETGMPSDARLNTVNPATAALLLTGTPLGVGEDGVGGLAVRPTDGAIFGSGGARGNIYRVTLSSATLLGATGIGGPGDLDFATTATVPEPATLLLVGAGLVVTAGARRRRRV